MRGNRPTGPSDHFGPTRYFVSGGHVNKIRRETPEKEATAPTMLEVG